MVNLSALRKRGKSCRNEAVAFQKLLEPMNKDKQKVWDILSKPYVRPLDLKDEYAQIAQAIADDIDVQVLKEIHNFRSINGR